MVCPEYRLRLFLSVDLVGSTAYKARFGDPDPHKSPNPKWVDQIRHFYREFPEGLSRNFNKVLKASPSGTSRGSSPVVWKTIGDEIVFCCRLADLEHLSYCMTAFLRTLKEYGSHLDDSGRHLDVKAYGWVAAFPSPNVTVEVYGRSPDPTTITSSELPDEYIEVRADTNPGEFDFLGKGIDSGFRSGRYCSADSLMLSLELAYLTANAAKESLLSHVDFAYTGRETLKGVINDRPYPLVSVDAERNKSRRQVRERERTLAGNGHRPTAIAVADFLDSFMDDEEIEKPMLYLESIEPALPQNYPQTYIDFVTNWKAVSKEIENRRAGEAQAETAEGLEDSLPPEITEALQKVQDAQTTNKSDNNTPMTGIFR